ncbi:hypothetical protein J6590_098634 [Homalodisca vitripennis]|nr:hypothetical protein J6590_098634 [Homalodisca vitripennis]
MAIVTAEQDGAKKEEKEGCPEKILHNSSISTRLIVGNLKITGHQSCRVTDSRAEFRPEVGSGDPGPLTPLAECKRQGNSDCSQNMLGTEKSVSVMKQCSSV